MASAMRTGLLAAALAFGAAVAASADNAPVYTLKGYSFGGLLKGANTADLTANLHKQGARITRADVASDAAALTKTLQERHLKGRLFTTLAEKHGRVWIIFDLLDLRPPQPALGGRRLSLQNFEGQSRFSSGTLNAATGLKPGDALSPEKLNAARKAILALYAKAMPGKAVAVKGRMQLSASGAIVLTWIVEEKK